MTENVLQGKRILYIEDDKLLSDIITRKFQSAGAQILGAFTVEEATAYLATGKVDAILMDLLLPNTTGLELVEHMGELINLKSIPAVIFSNLNRPEDIDRAEDLGIDKYFIKSSMVPDEVVKEVDALIRKYADSQNVGSQIPKKEGE